VNRFDAATSKPCGFVDSRCAPAHKFHKANSRNKPKRTNDVLPKPVKSECYRHSGLIPAMDASLRGRKRFGSGRVPYFSSFAEHSGVEFAGSLA